MCPSKFWMGRKQYSKALKSKQNCNQIQEIYEYEYLTQKSKKSQFCAVWFLRNAFFSTSFSNLLDKSLHKDNCTEKSFPSNQATKNWEFMNFSVKLKKIRKRLKKWLKLIWNLLEHPVHSSLFLKPKKLQNIMAPNKLSMRAKRGCCC